MAINTLATATVFQNTLDQIAVQEALTGWMDANAGQVIYNGGAEVKIPKLNMDGMADYDRDNGYQQGGVTLTYGTYTLTQDRGRKFQLDAMDINENNFVTTGATVMGEFQRTKVIPEVDAYRLSKCAQVAIAKKNVKYGYTPAAATILAEIKAGIKTIREAGYNGELIIHISYVGDQYPTNFVNLPAIQYTEENNAVYEWTDGQEQKASLAYRIDIWHNQSTSQYALEIDAKISALGLRRVMCMDAPDPSQLKHKVMRYEGIIDLDDERVYNNSL